MHNPYDVDTQLNSNIRALLKGNEEIRKGISPRDQLTAKRLDVVVKYLYARSVVRNTPVPFFANIYKKHIGDINGFVEADDTRKVGAKAFFDSFNELIASCQEKDGRTFLIPVDQDGHILDGAHRLAIALAKGFSSIDTIMIPVPGQNYDYSHFRNGNLTQGELDLVIHEYCKLKPETRAVLVWPIAKSKDIALNESLTKFSQIVHRKDISINPNGLVQLVKSVYKNEPWLGNNENDFQGARNKARWCQKDGANLTLFVIEPNSDTDIVAAKESLRQHFGFDKHSVHINDTHAETLELCELLLSENSVDRLNCSRVTDLPKLGALIASFEKHIAKSGLGKSDFIVLGSLLATHGIRDCEDLDYANTAMTDLCCKSEGIELDREKLSWIEKDVLDLIFDPKNHYYYAGFKFLSAGNIFEMKSRRRRSGDALDLEIVATLLDKRHYHAGFKEILKRAAAPQLYKQQLKKLAYGMRYALYRIFWAVRG